MLTTVNHLNANVFELTVADEQGRQERVRPTGSHKFYSLDRGDFIPTEALREGEHLQGIAGRLTLLRRERVPGVHRVYNMTVEGEHLYRVSLLGALVYNMCPVEPPGGGAPSATPGGAPKVPQGWGNLGSHGPVSPDVALSSAEKWLGAGYKEIAPGVYRSADGRQFRMTTSDLLPTHGNVGPHVHFEVPNPAGGPPLENLHLPVTP
ncbi:hypothetical protein JCM17478_36830 [Thermopirellula anaerolimosa]